MITIVTGLWDIGRGSLSNDWSRTYEHYLNNFSSILSMDHNMIIFGDEELKSFVEKYRSEENTQFIIRNKEWFKNNEYFNLIQEIRNNENWYGQTSWLKDSTQGRLEYYNPLVMSKMFLLNDATILDKFNSDYLFWLDAGISNTIHHGYFTHDRVIDKLPNYINDFLFVTFPYNTTTEIHGFDIKQMDKLTNNHVNKVCRGGFFGGKKENINNINTIYYNYLINTLKDGYMGTEESIFSIMLYNHPDLLSFTEIEENGLLYLFFENLKNDNLKIKKILKNKIIENPTVGLYVISFNSPSQFKTLIKSMLEYDSDFITKTKKFLLDNSTDITTTPKYIELCDEYNFEHIKKDNLGICGGRQWVAEHFDKSDLDYIYFFEDDMFFYPHKGEVCRNGFNRYVSNLYQKCLEISMNENFDFLKLNFTEFYGDNSVQWAWYNTPQHIREELWGDHPNLPVQGLDPNPPKTKFNNIKTYKGLPYATGEIFYCNWPQLVTKEGNKKMFINTKFDHPYEQVWMSYIYQETKKGNINPGILLLTPTEHDRFEFYSSELRKEN